MSNQFIQVPPDSTGKRVDMEELTVSGQVVQRQRFQIAGDTDVAIAPVSATDGLSVSSPLTTPNRSSVSSLSIAAGGQADLDSAQITNTLTGKLMQLLVSSSVPFKAELKTVIGSSGSVALVTWVAHRGEWAFTPPHKGFFTVLGGSPGLEAFRVTVTNLDTASAADFYATFLYDEQ
jgi:hypothetical protein